MGFEGFTDVSDVLKSGIYLLVKQGVVVYVGQSRSMYVRIYSHRLEYTKRRKQQGLRRHPSLKQAMAINFDAVHIQPCPIPELDKRERELIAKYQPKYNTQHKAKIEAPLSLTINGLELVLNAIPLPSGPRFERRI